MTSFKKILFFILMFTLFLLLPNSDIIFGYLNRGKHYANTLIYYRYFNHDRQKLKATKYLVENARFHYSRGKFQGNLHEVEQLRLHCDSIYYTITTESEHKNSYRDSLTVVQKRMRTHYDSIGYPPLSVTHYTYINGEVLTRDFLIEHIDHAFEVWHTSPFACNLSFDEFKEMILPYCAIQGTGFHETSKKLNDIYARYVINDTISCATEIVQKYNTSLYDMRRFELFKPRDYTAGIYDLYSNGLHDCVEIAEYGARIFRSCGLPVATEYNVCYIDLIDRHYNNVFYNDSTDKWIPFNSESCLPIAEKWETARSMNVYRITYEPQKNTPFFLRNKNEFIPQILSDPCIKDVTDYLIETVSITLPFTHDTENNLAYLATFNREARGMMPVTWGVIDKRKRQVTFNHLRENAMYIPIYYNGNECIPFGEPFHIKIVEGMAVKHNLLDIEKKAGKADMLITRKFPRKKNMIKVANNLVGGQFLGANKPDFSDAVVLYEITEAPMPHFLEYDFEKMGKYRYYRFQAPAEHPNANISMLEWMTSADYDYANTAPATRPHILQPQDYVHDSTKVQLLDAPFGSSTWKSEYDGNMLTAPGAYPNITLRLKEKQIVTGVRFAPLNADNGINSGDVYELYYWENGWKQHATVRAEQEFVLFKDVPQGKMYWLKNISKGREETPFIMVDGKQIFIYQDIIGYKE